MLTVGWKSTYGVYYSSYTKHTLDLMLHHLTRDRNLTFVWPEVMFLQEWYEDLKQREKDDFKKFVAIICLRCLV